MKQDIFEKVGKRTPFRTPEGYFEASEQLLKARSHRPVLNSRRWYYGIAASILLTVGIFSIVRFSSPTATQVEASFYSQTYDNSADWSDFADADIFLDNLNE
jgi:hypothetical protein